MRNFNVQRLDLTQKKHEKHILGLFNVNLVSIQFTNVTSPLLLHKS